jgi:hypothetical protein
MAQSAGSQDFLLKARYALAVAQLEVRRLLIQRARKQYDPNQPRVPAGNPDGGQWTSGGGSGGGPRSEYAQLRPRRLPGGYRIVGGRAHVATPAQEARLDFTAAQARALVREVQRRDPSWKPRPSIYEGVEGQILANQSEAQQAAARLRELGIGESVSQPLHDILRPGGQMLGSRQGRASGGTRTVTRQEFGELLEALSPDAQPIPSPRSYDGLWYRRTDGSVFGIRRRKDNGITIDVIRSNHPSIRDGEKVHKE